MNEQIKINWYRCKIDKKIMSELMKTSNYRGFKQVFLQLGLFFTTGMIAYFAYRQIHVTTWHWALPLTLLALFVHGTFSCFIGMAAPVHELSHKTPFRTKAYNEFFLRVFAFLSWSDYLGFRASHVKHHQNTTHADHDEEVILPQKVDLAAVQYVLASVLCNPKWMFNYIKAVVLTAAGRSVRWNFDPAWLDKVITNPETRRQRQQWALTVVLGHLGLACLFIATGNWFLILVFDLGVFYCGWLTAACGTPQHYGLSPNTPDFRLCCRTFTCGWLPAFLYWNMQHHIEHHMFPAVPFYNLPRLREAIKHDLPPATHGLWATWKHLVEISHRQKKDPNYCYVPELPNHSGERVGDNILELEASAQVA